MHEHSYTKEDLRQILLGIALPQTPLKKPAPKILQEEILQKPEQAQNTTLKINTLPRFFSDSSQKILSHLPLLASNIKTKQKEPKNPPQDSKKQLQLQEENERLTHTISQLTLSLASYKTLAKTKEQEAKTLQELQKELSEQKANLGRLLCERKELDETIALIHQEKATLVAKLKDLAQKNSSQTSQQLDLQKRLEALQQQTASLQEQLASQLCEKEEHKKHYEEAHVLLKTTLTETQGKLEDERAKSASLKELYEQTVSRLQEHDAHAKQLEQHLARRVKECAQALKYVEEVQKENQLLQQSLASSDSSLKSTLQELEPLKKEREELLALKAVQEQELDLLKKDKERLTQMEHLFSQCEKIFSKACHE